MSHEIGAQRGQARSSCFANDDHETGPICERVTTLAVGTLIGEGFGPPSAATFFPTHAGVCRYRGGDNRARSGQFCRNDNDCCNGLNLVCRNDKCQR